MPGRRAIGDHAGMAAQPLPWGTQWDLVRAADPAVDCAAFLVTFGLQQGRAGGKAPVNRYFGTLEEGPDATLLLGPMASTMMAGGRQAMAAESAYFGLLTRVRGYRAGFRELVLIDEDGAALLCFAPSVDPT